MKKLLLLLSLVGFVSCSSSVVNDAKIGGAKMLGAESAKFIDKEYKKMTTGDYSSMGCAAESVKIGEYIRLELEKLLKVEKSGFMSLSVGGEIAKVACGMVASKVIPDLIKKEIGDYPCFSKRFGDFAKDYIEKELCNAIEF